MAASPPARGSYDALARHLLQDFREGRLGEEVLAELAVADKSLMRPLKNNTRACLNADFLKRCVRSENGPKTTLAIRMVREFPDEPGLYEKMKSHFIEISTTDGYWLRQQKTYLSSALPYFSEFDGDDETQNPDDLLLGRESS